MDAAQTVGAEYGLSAAEVRFLLAAATRSPMTREAWIQLAMYTSAGGCGRITINLHGGNVTERPTVQTSLCEVVG